MRNWPYFVGGNFWLLMALVLWLGRNAVRTGPTRYSFFGVGGWLSPFEYGLLVVACAFIGAALMFLWSRPANTSDPR